MSECPKLERGECSMFVKRMREKNMSPMPIIGVYAALATLACSLAMVLNNGYKWSYHNRRKVNFSNKFFALNATSLTLLAVATKLTGDLTTEMLSPQDNLVKITSIAFLTIAMGNFLTTLGPMNDKHILSNVTALSILVITVLVNMSIQLGTSALDYSLFPEIICAMVLLFFMFIMIVCSALAVPAIKKQAESRYEAIHNAELEGRQHTVEELRLSIRKYSVMAATSSPQFMMTRLVTFIPTGSICLLSASILIAEQSRWGNDFEEWTSHHCKKESDYKWSVNFILYSQFLSVQQLINMDVYLLVSILRCKYEENGIKINRESFTMESFWTEKLVEWKQSSIPLKIERGKARKVLHHIKGLILTFGIHVQTVVVMCCKLTSVVFFYTLLPLVFLVHHCDKLISKKKVSNDERGPEIDLNCYVILLEGEKQLSQRFLTNINYGVDEEIKKSKKQQPQKLFNLLNQSFSFAGVIEFDSNQVPSLLSDEPPNCWTLAVVTLTSIAIALPNIASQHIDWLVSSVDEGLHYASLVDVMDTKHWLKSVRNAADVVWVGVEYHKKWLDIDLERKAGEINSAKETIQALADIAERTVMQFISTENRFLGENPLYWPANILASNSMYRVSRTILLYYENNECQAEELFRKLICMIADILAACLTNLPHVIATKCICISIEERENSVGRAAALLGETEDILKHFEERQLSSRGPSQPLFIDEWRRWIESHGPTTSGPATTNGLPSGLHC